MSVSERSAMHNSTDAPARDRQRALQATLEPFRALRAVAVLMFLAVTVVGCGSAVDTFPEGSVAIVASSDISIASPRLLVGVMGPEGQRLGSADDSVTLEIVSAARPGDVKTLKAVWTWIVEDAIGLWRSESGTLTEGQWLVRVVPETGPPTTPAGFVVRAGTVAPDIGEPAPSPDTPTLTDAPLSALTTDDDPNERFYRSSIADVVASGETAVVVFATPAFCVSAACGPLLEITKAVAPDYPEVTFVHVEVYTGFDEPGFRPGADSLAPALGPEFWNLPSEPWVFVIDEGVVVARFEGVMAPEELHAALNQVSSGSTQ